MQITIEGLSSYGSGFTIHKPSGRKIFVDNVVTGDEIEVEIVKENKKFIFANLVRFIKKSYLRKDPECRYFPECGGCSLQHLEDGLYKEFKKNSLSKILNHNNISSNKIEWNFIGSESRRRVVFQISESGEIGFFKKNTHQVIKISDCLILEKQLSQLLEPLQKLIFQFPKKFFNKISATHFDNGIGINLDLSNLNLENSHLSRLVKFSKDSHLIYLTATTFKENTIIYQKSVPRLSVGDFQIDLANNIFLQATKRGQDLIGQIICQNVNRNHQIKKVIDLYSGIGSYGFYLLTLGTISKLDAFEGMSIMVDILNKNIFQNNIGSKFKAFERDLVFNPLRSDEIKNYDLAIINPPRNGAKSQIKNIAISNIKNVIIVSCNPNSFASDVKYLIDSGYILENIYAIDQFTYSNHLEIVSYLTLKTHPFDKKLS